MRRSASEIICNLETRIARLEKSAGLLPISSEMYFPNAYAIEEKAIQYLKDNHSGVDWDVSSVKFKKQDGDSGHVEITGRFKTESFVMVQYEGDEVPTILEEQQPFKDCHFVNYTSTWQGVRGEIYPNKGLSLTDMIEVDYDARNGKWVVSSEDKRFNFELESSFKPDVEADALAKEINKRLR